jgi:hypothetical protein
VAAGGAGDAKAEAVSDGPSGEVEVEPEGAYAGLLQTFGGPFDGGQITALACYLPNPGSDPDSPKASYRLVVARSVDRPQLLRLQGLLGLSSVIVCASAAKPSYRLVVARSALIGLSCLDCMLRGRRPSLCVMPVCNPATGRL